VEIQAVPFMPTVLSGGGLVLRTHSKSKRRTLLWKRNRYVGYFFFAWFEKPHLRTKLLCWPQMTANRSSNVNVGRSLTGGVAIENRERPLTLGSRRQDDVGSTDRYGSGDGPSHRGCDGNSGCDEHRTVIDHVRSFAHTFGPILESALYTGTGRSLRL
jgi:hypothetical protein